MTLQAATQILGAVGVIASLIYVAIQIRNNARATRASTYQAVSGSLVTMWETLAANPDMLSMILQASEDFGALDRLGKARARMAIMAYMRRYENAWFQRRVGTMREPEWQAVVGDMEVVLSMPGTREIWRLIRSRSGAEFRAYVDGMAARHEAAQALNAARDDQGSAKQVRALADAYTAAWNSGSATAVASHYAADGQIVINRGEPWLGRDRVAAMAAGFFADVPDLVLTCDGLRIAGDHVAFLWTFTGHHAGTGKALRISGLEEWDLDADVRIRASRGWFDAAEYARQTAA